MSEADKNDLIAKMIGEACAGRGGTIYGVEINIRGRAALIRGLQDMTPETVAAVTYILNGMTR